MQLRTDATVRRWEFGPYDELDKTGAHAHAICCPELDGPLATAAQYRGRLCVDCPGHEVYRCRGCGEATVWPVPGPECQPSVVARRRRPPPHPGSHGPRRD